MLYTHTTFPHKPKMRESENYSIFVLTSIGFELLFGPYETLPLEV